MHPEHAEGSAAFCPQKTGVWDPNVLRPTCTSPICAVPRGHMMHSFCRLSSRLDPEVHQGLSCRAAFWEPTHMKRRLQVLSQGPNYQPGAQHHAWDFSGPEHQLPASSSAPARSFLTPDFHNDFPLPFSFTSFR